MGAASVTAFSRSNNKEQEVRGLGADEFVVYTDEKQAKAAVGSVDILLITADANNMPYSTFLSFLAVRGTCIMVGLPNDDIKFNAFQVVGKGAKFVGSNVGSIQDMKDTLEVASKHNVRPVIQKLPMAKVNEGIDMVRKGTTMSTAPRTIHAYATFAKGEEAKPWEYQSRPLGPEDVEIKISHCGICGSDLHTMDSGWSQTMYPCVVGHEIVGEVTLVGDQVKDMKVGDRVGVGAQVWACLNKFPDEPCKECANGTDAYCRYHVGTYNSKYRKTDGAITYGGYADYIRVTHEYAFKIPDNIPSDVAAPLLCAGTTVFTPFKEVGIKPGDRVGIVGVGGLGHLGIQFAKAMGAAAVVAFSRSASKEQEIRRLGADEFVVYTDEKAGGGRGQLGRHPTDHSRRQQHALHSVPELPGGARHGDHGGSA
ncbi:D-isomer specific 2-hydroxyacid dehydrogenase, NAD-binding domain conserved site 1 [Phytophthora cactorum]|nr:D-isomer specific 2-hydroxyacid dehydrogenase, NAD-binding domain conserved site 1 [Phytophthora cactorum]